MIAHGRRFYYAPRFRFFIPRVDSAAAALPRPRAPRPLAPLPRPLPRTDGAIKSLSKRKTQKRDEGRVPGEAATSTSSSSPYSVAPSVPVVFTLPFGVGATALSSPLSSVSALLSLSACTWLGGRALPPRPRRLPRRPLVGGGGGEGENEVEEAVSRTRRLEMMESSASSYGRANSLRK